MRGYRQRGFTLIELVVTLVISAVVVSFVSMFISGPVRGFADQARRARLVDAADAALQRIGRDVRRSLPNSVRTTAAAGVVALEMLSTVDGARYRAQPPGTTAQILDFATADGSFNVLGPFTQLTKPWSSTTSYLAIYNVGVPGAEAYELANVITPAGTTISIAADGATGEDRVTLTPAFKFSYSSPTQRVFLVDGPVTYLCDTRGGHVAALFGLRDRRDPGEPRFGRRAARCRRHAEPHGESDRGLHVRVHGWHCRARRPRDAFDHDPLAGRIGVAVAAGSRGQRAMTRARATRQQGFSLVSTIFLLVVLAGLGVYAVRMNTLQQQTVTAGLRGAQAYQAARTGVAWGAYRALNASACAASTTLNLTEGAASGFRVAVQCTQRTHTEGAGTVHVYVFDVKAEGGTYGGPDYVSRRLQTKITDAT